MKQREGKGQTNQSLAFIVTHTCGQGCLERHASDNFCYRYHFKKNCFECHKPHSSKEAHLSDLKTIDLCYSCHEDVHAQVNGAKIERLTSSNHFRKS